MHWTVIALLTLTTALNAQSADMSVVLPRGQARRVTRLCSRRGPFKVDSSWTPASSDIAKLEANLANITSLHSEAGEVGDLAGQQIEKPERYYRQYVGIVVNGKKLIYVNAACHPRASDGWRTQFLDGCGGGSCYWGVEYDPRAGRFSNLHVNGRM